MKVRRQTAGFQVWEEPHNHWSATRDCSGPKESRAQTAGWRGAGRPAAAQRGRAGRVVARPALEAVGAVCYGGQDGAVGAGRDCGWGWKGMGMVVKLGVGNMVGV